MQIKMPVKPPAKKKRRKSLLLSFLGFAFTAGVFVFLAAAGGLGYFLWMISKDLPDYDKLANYKPPVITRVHAGDGRLIAEFAKERRIYVPVQNMPKMLINAFLAAEDQNFYEHNGLDFRGILRAVYNNATKKKKEGASTITQQVAKNFLLTSEQSYLRKAKEAILAVRIERAYTKDHILELYLNQIYLGAAPMASPPRVCAISARSFTNCALMKPLIWLRSRRNRPGCSSQRRVANIFKKHSLAGTPPSIIWRASNSLASKRLRRRRKCRSK